MVSGNGVNESQTKHFLVELCEIYRNFLFASINIFVMCKCVLLLKACPPLFVNKKNQFGGGVRDMLYGEHK